MMRMLILLAALLSGAVAPAAGPFRYAERQVWSYKARAIDRGSLLRIWKIDRMGDGQRVFHVSVIGLGTPRGSPQMPDIQHLPITEAALDRSVMRRVDSDAVFPDPSSGYVQWHRQKGAPFTMTVAEVVDLVARSMVAGKVK
ncbi:hypothetical protein CLG96_11035 [Sphingomonas oleivorans]|uniref:DUF3108 domain-containing protein n=1 Tax=Sphingomonas oleivorans TaxID=1735121 RepID=A0A2T5FXR5_9SPHN|nr:hypothetical protein [Sphingomonas oleivorans]PTQ10912.1 hypothetical protein CLG96_11035 [Sphingomonas oleivorans]